MYPPFAPLSNVFKVKKISSQYRVFGAALLLCTPIVSMGNLMDELAQSPAPASVAKQSRMTKLINYLIDKSHYRAPPLDDHFSEKVLDRYLRQLDPAKHFFLQSDIDQFETIRFQFDNFIKSGNLEPAFAIFSVYRTRVDQRVQYALQRVEKPFDFNLDEDYLLDREEAEWAKSPGELDNLWRQRIKNDILIQKLSHRAPAEISDSLKRRYTHLARTTRQFKSDDVFQTFINAYVGTVEPHTTYYTPRATENFKINMRLSLEGIGAVLQTDSEYTVVRRVIPGGPADMAGQLRAEDRIIGVGQEGEEIVDVIGWRLDDVVQLIRGPKALKLAVVHGENGVYQKPETISITRDKIKLEEQAAKKDILEIPTEDGTKKIGVIDLPSFYSDFDGRNQQNPNYRSTTQDVRKLLNEFHNEDIVGLIIDLRGNGGGALPEAISLTGLFIPRGPVVQVKNTEGKVRVNYDPDPNLVYDGPLVVLVDRHSASASEIFAGAIQDYRRGLIVGEPTFGKGTVQNVVNLNRFSNDDEDLGQLKITIAQFFRVNGESTQHRGIIPDLIWSISELPQDSGERSYENSIPWQRIKQARYLIFRPESSTASLAMIIDSHKNRVFDNPEFGYVKRVRDINKKRGEINTITLNEARRKGEREALNKERLDLENARRLALGQPVFENISSLEKYNERRLSRGASGGPDDEPDAFLIESGNILLDYYFPDRPVMPSPGPNLVQQTPTGDLLRH